MFYKDQPQEQQEQYKKMLKIMGSLTALFSENKSPYLAYRAHENIFCKFFDAENLARFDCSADAKKGNIGVGLKTWTGTGDQKVAEFGKLRAHYKNLSGLALVKCIATYRNERIELTKRIYGIENLVYHIIRRIPDTMQVLEYAFETINVENITLLPDRGNANNTYFTDGKNTYHFSESKNTLYMLFEGEAPLDEFKVEILEDPYSFLMNLVAENLTGDEVDVFERTLVTRGFEEQQEQTDEDRSNKVCLRLYSVKKDEKFVPEKSGLNQWNADGRTRHPNEVYISYPSHDRNNTKGFFPARDTPFSLSLPNGEIISAKICQADGKAIMSNPNKILGEWLLRTVFALPERTLLTYSMLEKFGIDSVIFTKKGELNYAIDFVPLGTYESFNNQENLEDDDRLE